MVSFPNAKINIGLRVVGKRPDGYHNIETAFYPVAWNDALEIIPAGSGYTQFNQSGMAVPGDEKDNLCLRAYQLLKNDFPSMPAVNIHLYKAIPVGAGLGGGSADASSMLKLLNSYFKLGIPEGRLIAYALDLGSDCPFFIKNTPCLATGRGEILSPVNLDLSAYKILLIYPGVHINTGWAFANIRIQSESASLAEYLTLPVREWQEHLNNDFEQPVFQEYPTLKKIKETLQVKGALYASLSGSGSAVYGIFEKNAEPSLDFPVHYLWKWV